MKVSYYKYTTITGKTELLAFVVNISSQEIKNVAVSFRENVSEVFNAETLENMELIFDIKPYGYKILYLC